METRVMTRLYYLLLGFLLLNGVIGCEDSNNRISNSNVVTSVVPDGAYWKEEVLHWPNPPENFRAVIGWAIAATLSPDQVGEPARLIIDYMKLIEEHPEPGVRILSEKHYDNEGPRPLICIPNSTCEGGLYDRFPRWFATNNHTPIFNSEIKDGVLTLDVSATPRNIVHWWTDKKYNQPNARYSIEMRVKIEGKVGVQLGVDYWVDLYSPYNGWAENCEGSNNCEIWVSDWFGDTGGEFVTIRAPHY